MFKNFCFLLLVLIGIHQSNAGINPIGFLKEIERALKENRITIDELLAESSLNDEDNEINPLNPFSMNDVSLNKDACRNSNKMSCRCHEEPDYSFNARQMVEYRGFKFEAHHVVTEDCYILELHRIVNPLNKTKNKPPILLQHGLVDSSTAFMFNTLGGSLNDQDDRNLAFALAKRGYDVWLGNYRGNTYSKNHTTFSTKDPQFWKFTFDNHALQDLPAQIGYVQNATNYDQIGYLGFSQGTLTMFNLLALKPEVSKAIKPYIAMAPVAHLGSLTSPLRYLAASYGLMKALLFKNTEFLPNSQFSRIFSSIACRAFPGLICKNFLYLICGFSDHQMNSTRMPVYFNHLPAGTSLANVVHYGLNVREKKTQMLDYMTASQNMECYNSLRPPQIELENINVTDLYLLHSQNDLLADVKDVELLKKQLKVKFQSKLVEVKRFGHVDFVLSQKADYYVNDYIIKVLEAVKPSMSVDKSKKLRLKSHDTKTCVVANTSSRCHLNFNRALNSID